MNVYKCRWCGKEVERESDAMYLKSFCTDYDREVWLKRIDLWR